MKKGFIFFVLMLFATPGWSQDRVKIGFIDMQRALNESQPGKKARERLQAEFKKAEAGLLREEEEVKRLKSDFDKKGPLLKDEERRNLEKEFQRRYMGLQRSVRDQQEEFRQRESELANEIIKELQKVVSEVGKSERFTLILERSQLLYSDDAIDITTRVIELYNGRISGKAPKGK